MVDYEGYWQRSKRTIRGISIEETIEEYVKGRIRTYPPLEDSPIGIKTYMPLENTCFLNLRDSKVIPPKPQNPHPPELTNKISEEDPELETLTRKLTLVDLLDRVGTYKNPGRFKEVMLRIAQLYFDGLIEQKDPSRNPMIWLEQKEALEAILTGVRQTVSGFYRKNGEIPFLEIRELIRAHEKGIIFHGSSAKCKYRHLEAQERNVADYAISVASALSGEEIDLVIPIASGGFEPAILTADYLGVPQIFPVRCSRVSRADNEVLTPNQAPENYTRDKIIGKRILIVDDIVSSGGTIDVVTNWLKTLNPARLYFAAVKFENRAKTLNNEQLHRSPVSDHLYVDHRLTA